MIRLGIFIILSVLLLIFTLCRTQRYRFFRFFAFESLFALILINAPNWFAAPFSPVQIISWIHLAGSLLLAVHGFKLLRISGASEGDIENTTQLVKVGAYRYIRHPLYCSIFLAGVGALLKQPHFLGFLLLASIVSFVFATAKVEESENREKFGEVYEDYVEQTKMFIPYLV